MPWFQGSGAHGPESVPCQFTVAFAACQMRVRLPRERSRAARPPGPDGGVLKITFGNTLHSVSRNLPPGASYSTEKTEGGTSPSGHQESQQLSNRSGISPVAGRQRRPTINRGTVRDISVALSAGRVGTQPCRAGVLNSTTAGNSGRHQPTAARSVDRTEAAAAPARH